MNTVSRKKSKNKKNLRSRKQATPAKINPRVRLYEEIEEEYLDGLRAAGILFAPKGTDAPECKVLLERLKEKGARFRNGTASISINNLSSACIACTGDPGSKTFLLSVQCHRDCYYCFNTNQKDYEKQLVQLNDWQSELEAYAAELKEQSVDPATFGFAERAGRQDNQPPFLATHIALTGGEPLIHKEETIGFFKEVRHRYPEAHTRLYTSGDLLNSETFKTLQETDLTEIRFSVKLEDPPKLRNKVLGLIKEAKASIPQVMVEMPVIPDTKAEMETLLLQLDEIGIYSINLLEFGFPLHRWEEFSSRDFKVKNPPYEVLYNYYYAGGLPVQGSELLALELLDFALDRELSLGVHYCSMANKHRDQVFTMNRPHADTNPVYLLDESDFFLKSAVAFDRDREKLLQALSRHGSVAYFDDPTDNSLQINPRDKGLFDDLSLNFYTSSSIVEIQDGEPVFRELKLEKV